MTTTHRSFPRLKSAGVQGAKAVGREQLTKISTTQRDHSWSKRGEAGERSKGTQETSTRSTQETSVRK